MPKFPVFTSKEIIKILEKNGFIFVRQKGSHKIFINRETNRIVTIPFHKKDLPIGTTKSILKAADINI